MRLAPRTHKPLVDIGRDDLSASQSKSEVFEVHPKRGRGALAGR